MTVSSSLATLCQKLCSSFNAQSGIRDRPDDHRAPALLSSKPWRCFDKKLKVECDDNEDASTTVETDTRVGSVSDLDFFSQPSSSSETHSGCEMPALPVHVEVATRTTQAAKLVRPWSTSGFEFVKPLQDARRNHGVSTSCRVCTTVALWQQSGCQIGGWGQTTMISRSSG